MWVDAGFGRSVGRSVEGWFTGSCLSIINKCLMLSNDPTGDAVVDVAVVHFLRFEAYFTSFFMNSHRVPTTDTFRPFGSGYSRISRICPLPLSKETK